MEPRKKIGGFRALLPYEVELCEALGITAKEYFEFLDLAEAYTARKKEYDHIPEIVGMPQVALVFANLGFWGQVAVAVALTAIAYVLTPKPKDPSQAPRLEIGGVQGRSRFNRTSGFDSLQDLATLGSFIPLVYARQGVRVSSQLLWSQVRTTQYGESINAIVLFSNGTIGAKPKFESLALGDLFLADLPESKLKVYFSRGARPDGRLQGVSDGERSTLGVNDDQYSQGSAQNKNNYGGRDNREYDDDDPFLIKTYDTNYFAYKPSFSSTKTPTTNNAFGVYNPMPNGNAYKVRWELLLQPKDGDDDVGQDTRHKMGKVMHKYPRYVSITSRGDSDFYESQGDGVVLRPSQVQAALDAPSGVFTVNYRIYHAAEESAWIDSSITTTGNDASKKWNRFSPWGSSDAKSVVDTGRENVDDSMAVGEQYMVGSCLMTVREEDNGNKWLPGILGFDKAIKLEADEAGYIEFRNLNDAKMPFESLVVQKVELATFSNTRRSDVTEIGIKSKVWRKINGFPNVNEMPSQERIRSYEEKNGSIQLGAVSKYVKRLSFFLVQAKRLNSGDNFENISNTPICIKGSSPVAQYNAISIKHLTPSQYEFRFKPIPGNVVLNYHRGVVHVLSYAETIRSDTNNTLGLTISYHAKIEQLPTDKYNGNTFTNNPEWDRGGLGVKFADDGVTVIEPTGPVDQLSASTSGVKPVDPDLVFTDKVGQFIPPNQCTYYGNGLNNDPTKGQPLQAQHTNVTNYNYKGTPINSNAYFSPIKGVYVRSEVRGAKTRWTYSVGGSLIPTGSTARWREYDTGTLPYGDQDWSEAVEEIDKSTGAGIGIWHRFRLARNPADWGGGEDWRRGEGNGVNLYAIAIQQSNKIPTITVTENTRNTSTTGDGTGLVVSVKTETDGTDTLKTFTILSGGNGYKDGDTITILNESPTINLTVQIVPQTIDPPDITTHSDWRIGGGDGTAGYYTDYWKHIKHNPNNAISDFFLFDAESSSHESGPEHELTYVNEIVHSGSAAAPQINYENLAIGGIRIGASNTLSSFNSFSAFIEEGIVVDRLIPDHNYTSGTSYLTRNSEIASTDNFVEIAHDLLTNNVYGAGDVVGHDGVDRASMIEGARYCRANGFFWNGIIDNKFNLREFIFENAAYNFLDFSILGGRFSLRPSFPIKDNYEIDYDATIGNKGIKIKALFTDGNMKDIKVTFLTPEERKMFKATVIHRKDERNSKGIAGFPENVARTYAYNPTGENATTFIPKAEKLPEEVFDFSNWCTSESHAKLFAAIALTIRKEVDHGIVFQTPPSSVFGLLAGDYIRVLTEATHTSRFNNGSIDANGVVISRSTISGSINAYVWSPGSLGGVEEKTFSVGSDGKNSLGLTNKLFAQVDTTEEDRIYKVESITYGEEGFIEIAGSHVPLTSDDKLAVLYHANPNDAANNVDYLTRFPELRG